MSVEEHYHAHVYFDENSRNTIEKVQSGLREHFGERIRVSTLRERPIGPHPLPMFEVVFREAERVSVTAWLEEHRFGHTVLMHPVMDNDLIAHTNHAQWLGEELPLDYSVLR